MERYPAQPGYELVFDARRLIIACALVIFVCGIFFVLGFVEGKRQILEASLTERGALPGASEPAVPKGEKVATQPVAAVPGTAAGKPANDQQTWYDKANAQKSQPQPVAPPKPAPVAAAPSGPATKPTVSPSKSTATLYSCQVGAFRQQKEAQIKADELKNRGYSPVIEAPESPGGLYLLKVGRFATRAEAVAMQTRLKKAGYNCFIKTGH